MLLCPALPLGTDPIPVVMVTRRPNFALRLGGDFSFSQGINSSFSFVLSPKRSSLIALHTEDNKEPQPFIFLSGCHLAQVSDTLSITSFKRPIFSPSSSFLHIRTLRFCGAKLQNQCKNPDPQSLASTASLFSPLSPSTLYEKE